MWCLWLVFSFEKTRRRKDEKTTRELESEKMKMGEKRSREVEEPEICDSEER